MKWIAPVLLLFSLAARAQDSLNKRYTDSVIRSYCPACQSPAKARPAYILAFHHAHGLVYGSRFDEAFPFVTTAMDGARSADNKPVLYFSYLLKAILFHARNLPGDALSEYREAITLNRNSSLPLLTELYAGSGLIFFDTGKYDSAYHYLSLAEKSLTPSSSLLVRKNLYANLSVYFNHLERYDQARTYAFKSLAIEQQLGNRYGIAQSCLDIGTFYYDQYQDAPAIRYYQKSLAISRRERYFQLQQYAADNMASLLADRGRYREAFRYLQESTTAKDSVYGRDRFLNLLDQQKKYEVAQKQTEIAKLEQEKIVREAYARQKALQSRIYLSVGIALLLLVAFIIMAYRQKAAANRRIEAQKNELDELNRTKDQLFSIISHDLRSPVQSLNRNLSGLKLALYEQDSVKAAMYVDSIETISNSTYALLNNLLHWSLSHTGLMSFHPERLRARALVDQVCYDYAPIALSKRIEISNDVPGHLHLYADLNAVRLILRNLIDNAIKYTSDEGFLRIGGHATGESCELVIEDSGIGMDEEIRQAIISGSGRRIQKDAYGNRSTGLGLSLVKSITESSGGGMRISSHAGQGTRITIILPLTHHYHEQPENINIGR